MKNQFTLNGYSYDAAGNVLQDGGGAYPCAGNTYTWDAEEQIVCAMGASYSYDGDGVRVGKSGGDSTGSVHYYFADALGSSNVVAMATGGVENESDFLPFGGELAVTQGLANQHYKFEGHERDAESASLSQPQGLDNFGARFDSSSAGRFMSPDWANKPEPVPYAKLSNPQSLNLYAFAQNNPESAPDLDGHIRSCGGNDGSTCVVTEKTYSQNISFADSSGKVYSTINVTTNLTLVSNSVTGAVVNSYLDSATATNVSGTAWNSSNLATAASTIGAVQAAGASMSLGTNPVQLITAITAKESTLGLTSPTNPLKLSTSSGYPPHKGDTQYNIQTALNVLQERGKASKYNPSSTYDRYNGFPDPIVRATNVRIFMNIYNDMTQSSSSYSPSIPAAPIPAGLQ